MNKMRHVGKASLTTAEGRERRSGPLKMDEDPVAEVSAVREQEISCRTTCREEGPAPDGHRWDF